MINEMINDMKAALPIFFVFVFTTLLVTPSTVVFATHRATDIDGYVTEQGRVIAWNVEPQSVTSNTATITWKTSQAVPTWLRYGETMRFGGEYKDEVQKTDHRVILEHLKPGTTYLTTVLIQDGGSVVRYHYGMESQMINYTSSPSVTTLTLKQEADQLKKQLEGTGSMVTFKLYGSKVSAAMSYAPVYHDSEQFDFSAPRITSLNLRGSSSQATLSWTTDRDMSEVYVEYGLDQSYGFWKQKYCFEQCTSHSLALDGLPAGEPIHFRMKMRGKYNDTKTAKGYSTIETGDISFIAPLMPTEISISYSRQDISAPTITSIGIKKILGESRRTAAFGYETLTGSSYDIPKRVELAIATDEPAYVSAELLHVLPDTYGLGKIAKEEALSSSGFNTMTTLTFEPPLDAARDYIYAVTAKDAAGNQYTTRFFRINARGDIRHEAVMLTAPSAVESITMPSRQVQSLSTPQSLSLAPFYSTTSSQATTPSLLARKLAGRIILQVQKNGEAWYVHPQTFRRYYLGRPSDALRVMREQGVGITNNDLLRIPRAGESRTGDTVFAKKQAGKIFLQIQGSGEAWYVNPLDFKRYYLGRPADALAVMRTLGLGISNADIETISVL